MNGAQLARRLGLVVGISTVARHWLGIKPVDLGPVAGIDSMTMKLSGTVLLLLAAAPAFSHDTWLSAKRPVPQPGGRAAFELTSAGRFPKPESVVAGDRLVRTGLRLGGAVVPLEPQAGGRRALRLAAPLRSAGAAVAWIETRPRTLTLTPKLLTEYLEEVGATQTIGEEWRKSGLATWRESYVKLAKTVFRVGADAGDRGWAEPVGLALEIVPETDPTALKPGDPLAVRLLLDGRPLAGLATGAVGERGPAVLRTSDDQGRATFTLGSDGPWLIRATLLRRASLPDADWQSWFTTLTFAVGSAAP